MVAGVAAGHAPALDQTRLDCVNFHEFLASACMKVRSDQAALIWIKRALW
jgi:hypothetical protein